MLHQAVPTGPPPPLHTTSDLLRLLAADAHPFAAVAEAVAARFGGGAESQAWLARTLLTLLRDGLLYTEAEKLNAAYLLRFAAPGAAGSRDALLHLALPDGGEPPAVRAWAAALAQPLPGEAPASGSSMGSIGSASSLGSAGSPAASPSWQQQQARTAALAAAALLHQRTPRQVLAEAAAPLDSQVQLSQLRVGAPPPPLPWQATANLSAAAAAPPPASFDALLPPGSPALAPSVPPWLQQPLPLSPRQDASPLASQAQQPAASFSPHLLSPVSPHHARSPLAQSPHQSLLQQLPPPLQPLAPEPAASVTFAAHQLQQQPQAPPLLQQQREQEELAALQALLQQAAQAPLVPAKQQQLVAALGGLLGPRLTAPLAAAVSSAGGGLGGLQPHHMRGLVEQNCPVASQLLLALLAHHPEAAAVYSAAVAELPMSARSVECLSAVAGGGALPGWVLATFLANCMQDVSACSDPGRQGRHVKLLCACVALVLQRQPHALAESLPELLAFCIEQSRHKQAADLYRHLRDLEAAAG
ncbi:hypothetical protein ABPG75_001677 [Micractinium tetrahymenae]